MSVRPVNCAVNLASGLQRLDGAAVDFDLRAGRSFAEAALAAAMSPRSEIAFSETKRSLDRHVKLARLQQRPVAVAAQQVVARFQVLPEGLGGRGYVAVNDARRFLRKIFEERGRRLEEQRQVAFDARGRDAVGDVLVDAAARGVALEALAKGFAELRAPFLVEREFARRQHAHFRDRVDRALRVDVEGADRLDLVAQQVEAIGHRAAGGKEVDQPAAHAEFAGTHHLQDMGVAGERQLRTQRVQVEARLGLQLEGPPREIGARRQALQRGRDGDDAHVEVAVGELPQGRKALRDQVGVRRELVVGQDLPVGEPVDAKLRIEPRDLLAQPLGVLRRGGEDEQRGRGAARARAKARPRPEAQ